MKYLLRLTQIVHQLQHLWTPLAMDGPDHPKELASHGKHGTAFRTIRARSKKAFHLPFEGPPVMNDKRMIHKNDRISHLETGFNIGHGSPSINDPTVELKQCFMLSMKLFC